MGHRLCIRTDEYLAWESGEHEITVNELPALQRALDVPLSELIDLDAPDILELKKAILLTYKSIQTLKRRATTDGQRLLIDRITAHLLRAMPEMEDVAGWCEVGKRRAADELSAREEHVVDSIYFSEQPTLMAM